MQQQSPRPAASLPELNLPELELAAQHDTTPQNQRRPGATCRRPRHSSKKSSTKVRKVYIGQDDARARHSRRAIFQRPRPDRKRPGTWEDDLRAYARPRAWLQFGRIQFTADLMPSDITGSPIFDRSRRSSGSIRPSLTQILLADEINRSPAKTHAALLEIMQEYRVTIERTRTRSNGRSWSSPRKIRSKAKGRTTCPKRSSTVSCSSWRSITPTMRNKNYKFSNCMASRWIWISAWSRRSPRVTHPDEIKRLIAAHAQVRIDERLFNYINQIVRLTRKWPQFHMGASPRAGLSLVQGPDARRV